MQRKPNEQFIQAYSEEFSEKVTLDFFDEHDKITGKEILTVSPSKQVNFFILKILFKKWQEEMKQLESPYFDYKNNEVRRSMVQFMNTLSQHIEVGESDLQGLMKEAVQETILLSIAPSTYLAHEFSGKKFEKLSEKNIKPFLKYLRIRKEEFATFFEQMEGASSDQILASSAEFLNHDPVDSEIEAMNQIIPISFDEIFYQEQEEDIVQPIIEEEFEEGLDALAEPDKIKPEVFEEDTPVEEHDDNQDSEFGKEEEEYQAVQKEPINEKRESFEEHEDSQIEKEQLAEERKANEPLEEDWKDESASSQAIEEEESDIGELEEAQEEKEVEEPIHSRRENFIEDTEEEDNQPTLNDRFQTPEKPSVAEKLTQNKVHSILDAISVNHRYMFTKELFDGDRDAFHSAILQVEECTSFDEAVELIVQTFAKKLEWDVNSDEVKELLKVVFRKFR